VRQKGCTLTRQFEDAWVRVTERFLKLDYPGELQLTNLSCHTAIVNTMTTQVSSNTVEYRGMAHRYQFFPTYAVSNSTDTLCSLACPPYFEGKYKGWVNNRNLYATPGGCMMRLVNVSSILSFFTREARPRMISPTRQHIALQGAQMKFPELCQASIDAG
jgi:hypothetical protein